MGVGAKTIVFFVALSMVPNFLVLINAYHLRFRRNNNQKEWLVFIAFVVDSQATP